MDSWVYWLILMALFMIAEMLTAGFFLLWFGIGAALAAGASLLFSSLPAQILVFAISSLVLFFLSRRFAENITGEQPPGIGANRAVGKKGIVIEDIDEMKGTGRVKVEHEVWVAYSEDGKVIKAGTKIETSRVDGTRLVVKKVE